MIRPRTDPLSMSPQLSDQDFGRLVAIASSEAGLMLPESKRMMVQSRIARHLRQIGIHDTGTYLDHLESPQGQGDRQSLVSVLTTNVSSFFREKHHFKFFADSVLPGLIAKANSGARIRIWSAGCSSGQEPYSIAMQTLANWPDSKKYDFKILATDIDRKILRRAREGLYSQAELESLPSTHACWLLPDPTPRQFRIHPSVRSVVTFKELNLLGEWPMRGQFDAIFCRNVVIYFDQQSQQKLWPRFRSSLTDGGFLFLGHSERLSQQETAHFESCSVTTYKRRTDDVVRSA